MFVTRPRRYSDFVDDDVPLRWMKVSPSTADQVRIVCVWCDQYDLLYGNVTWQLSEEPGSRTFRINIRGFKHWRLYPTGYLSAQVRVRRAWHWGWCTWVSMWCVAGHSLRQ